MDKQTTSAEKKSFSDKLTGLKQKLKETGANLRSMGKNIDPNVPAEQQKNVTLKEYISIIIARMGLILTSTVLGSYSSTFLYGCYYSQLGMDSATVGQLVAVITTITTVLGFVISALVSAVTYKWRTKLGRYRHWYIFGAIPAALLVVLNFVVPDPGIGTVGFVTFKYVVMILLAVIVSGASGTAGFFTVGGNIVQVISPNQSEKKTVITIQQLAYYLGYGAAYGGAFIFGLFFGDRKEMYLCLSILSAVIMCVGCMMMGFFCKERIDAPMKEKVKITKSAVSFFKYKNYMAYHITRFATVFAMTGAMIMYLAAIVVGADKAAAFAIPSAIGTGVGVLICTIISKKVRCTRILQFAGIYTALAGVACFITVFFTGFGVGYYITYFLFGISFGLSELSENHWLVEINDYLEWKTGERQEAIQGVIPGWITSGLGWLKSGVLIPMVMLPLIGYATNAPGNNSYMEYMQQQPTYSSTCNWLLAFALFGVSLSRLATTLVITFMYRLNDDDRKQMFDELSVMRRKRAAENLAISGAAVAIEEGMDELMTGSTPSIDTPMPDEGDVSEVPFDDDSDEK